MNTYVHSPALDSRVSQFRANVLEQHVDDLRVALRGMLEHCHPDKPPGAELWAARRKAEEVMRQLFT